MSATFAVSAAAPVGRTLSSHDSAGDPKGSIKFYVHSDLLHKTFLLLADESEVATMSVRTIKGNLSELTGIDVAHLELDIGESLRQLGNLILCISR